MKLYHLHEEEALEQSPFGEWLKTQVKRKIMKGESRLKSVLSGSSFTLEHVRFAIKNGECLRNPREGEPSLGPTYLEQTISNVLRDLSQAKLIPLGKLNDARAFFGLERLSMRKLKTEVERKKIDQV
jgi:hypothetical protein